MRLYSAFTLAVGIVVVFVARSATSVRAAQAPEIRVATVADVQKRIKEPGARAVLVNVWATWCQPCVKEMPDILRAYRENKARGLRLVLVSADPKAKLPKVEKFLAGLGVDFPSYLKTGDDMQFIDGLDPKWDGTLPASVLFDGKGNKVQLWSGTVSYEALTRKLSEVLGEQQWRNP
jgi:thiol-disulfide isomerase/thioredoxin